MAPCHFALCFWFIHVLISLEKQVENGPNELSDVNAASETERFSTIFEPVESKTESKNEADSAATKYFFFKYVF